MFDVADYHVPLRMIAAQFLSSFAWLRLQQDKPLESVQFMMAHPANRLARVIVPPVETPLLTAALDGQFIQGAGHGFDSARSVLGNKVGEFKTFFE